MTPLPRGSGQGLDDSDSLNQRRLIHGRFWTALTHYLEDSAVPCDNNWVENQIRPVALSASWKSRLQYWVDSTHRRNTSQM